VSRFETDEIVFRYLQSNLGEIFNCRCLPGPVLDSIVIFRILFFPYNVKSLRPENKETQKGETEKRTSVKVLSWKVVFFFFFDKCMDYRVCRKLTGDNRKARQNGPLDWN